MAKAPQNDIERCIDFFSQEPSLFPPGRQRLAEISQELGVDTLTLQEVVSHLSMGLLSFKEITVPCPLPPSKKTKVTNDL
jgi:hypothetical protein